MSTLSTRRDPQYVKESISGGQAVVVGCLPSPLARPGFKNEWDGRIKRDAEAGRLDEIACQVKADYEAGLTAPL